MCGINGIFGYGSASSIDVDELIQTRDFMAARGPDGEGRWISSDGRVGFGHRRLSIIDLSALGAQPMHSEDGQIVVVFNGEIYNYRELRRALESRGCVFRSTSDTEVLLHLYAAKQEAMLPELRGMFAFAIWDAARQRLILARDPYGIKPLYFADDGSRFRFASQVKALLAGGRVDGASDSAGLVGFHLFGSVPEPFTLYRQVRSLRAGSYVVIDRQGARSEVSYHSIAGAYRNAEENAEPTPILLEKARHALAESVRHHLVADVSVGMFLSSGVDSGALLGLMRDVGGQDIVGVTVAFEEFSGRHQDESPLAADIARRYGAQHVIRRVSEAEFLDDLPRILEAMDQPSIDGINTWFVAKAAREFGLKVAISGLGGDELFGGYPSFRDLPRWVRWLGLVPGGRLLRRLLTSIQPGFIAKRPKSAGLVELGGTYEGAYLLRRGLFMPWETGNVLDPNVAHEGLTRLDPIGLLHRALQPEPQGSFAKVATLEASMYMRNQLLRDADWAGMAHGVEIRCPLVDAQLLDQIAPLMVRLQGKGGKSILANAPSLALPDSVTLRAKTGFTIPIETWLRKTEMARNHALTGVSTPQHWSRTWARCIMVARNAH